LVTFMKNTLFERTTVPNRAIEKFSGYSGWQLYEQRGQNGIEENLTFQRVFSSLKRPIAENLQNGQNINEISSRSNQNY
jgi:hypothetical protein